MAVSREEFHNFLVTLPLLDSYGYAYLSTYFTSGQRIASPLHANWNTGGVSGGSCWDWSDPQPYDAGDSKRQEAVDLLEKNVAAVLKKFLPDLKFKDYEELRSKFVEESYTNTEYYGNYDDYTRRYIDEDVLFAFLNEKST